MLRSSCLARMSPKHTLFTFRTKVRMVRLSFLATRYNFQAHASWLSKKPSCTKILLNVRMRPVAIALNCSVENIRNDVRQKKCNNNIRKIPIRLTSVGLAHACPNKNFPGFCTTKISSVIDKLSSLCLIKICN